jgi:hypothetical protein
VEDSWTGDGALVLMILVVADEGSAVDVLFCQEILFARARF